MAGFSRILWKLKTKSRTVFKVPAMTLTSEEIRIYNPIQRALRTLEGIHSVNANYPRGEVLVESDPDLITTEEISRAIRSVGYKATKIAD